MTLQRSAVSMILRVGLLHLAVSQKMRRAGWHELEKATWADAEALLMMLRKLGSKGLGNAELMTEIFEEMISLGRDLEVSDVQRCERKLTNVPQTFNPV